MSYEQIFEAIDEKLQQDLCPGYQLIKQPEGYNWIIIAPNKHRITNGLYGITVIKILKHNPEEPLNAMDTAVLLHEFGHHVWVCRKRRLTDRAHMQQNRWTVMKEEWGAWRFGWRELEKMWRRYPKELTVTAPWMMWLTPYCLARYLCSLYLDRVDKFDLEI